ncbi:MAG: sigma-70 family RNA polymerase sigma factor [Acidimicrobiia bacterium]|nr:sigma-70 family RNA polymerase sigma factor [Acidimicrobiia bacterium]
MAPPPDAAVAPTGDDGLVAQAKAGNEQAWAALYEALHRPLLGYLRARGFADPEDALGEVFLRLARSLSHFDGGLDALRAYAFTIAQNLLRDSARASKARPRITFLLPDALTAAAAKDGRAAASAEEDALGGLDMSGLGEALAGLTPEQQHVLYLRVVGDQSIEETARAIGKSPGAVKQLHFRAMERLRRILRPSPSDAEARE